MTDPTQPKHPDPTVGHSSGHTKSTSSQGDSSTEALTPGSKLEELCRGCVDLHSLEELKHRLATGKKLRIKAGFDPTAPDLHLGHTVVLSRMRRFQEQGHSVVFVIGDFTARIGDPTGKSATRPALSDEAIATNAKTFEGQVHKVLDPALTEIRFNSEWLEPLGAAGLIRLASRSPVARMLERDDFKKRFRSGKSIAIHELLYPLLQAYDSVELQADVELGGTDQLFNLLLGRTLMRENGLAPQIVMTSPLLEGLDARLVDGQLQGEKMSKSLGNYIGIDESPEEIYGKTMSISDDLMWRYYELLSTKSLEEINELREQVTQGKAHPKAVKEALALELATRFHDEAAALRAAAAFERVHTQGRLPDEVPTTTLEFGGPEIPLAELLDTTGLCASRSEARRLIKGGGVRVDGERATNPSATISAAKHLLQVGKRKFLEVHPA